MTTTDATLADEANAILSGASDVLPGLEAESRVSILGTTFSTNEEFVLGQRVELRVTGYVSHAGTQLVENEGKRNVVKVSSTLITVIDTDRE